MEKIIDTTTRFKNFRDAALFWFKFGFNVIPIAPDSKCTALKWDPWLKNLSSKKIELHWFEHPEHQVGFILGEDIIAFDADSPESIAALAELEQKQGVVPKLVVKTKKGMHHYFRRAKGTIAKSDSHSTEKFPHRIDVKTGRGMVILPPSTGKSVLHQGAENLKELSEVSQNFIDAIYQHNGRISPHSSVVEKQQEHDRSSDPHILTRLRALVESIDPDCGYQDWLNSLMAIFHETGGSEEGFEIANSWSSKGKKYNGIEDLRRKWNSFRPDVNNPITIATLKKMIADSGKDWMEICWSAGPQFEDLGKETEIISPDGQLADSNCEYDNPLKKFSLLGKSSEIEKNVVAEVSILGQLALQGQLTVFYAAPNTGKTLITLSLLIDAIQQERVDSSKIYYLNVDDSSAGLIEKLRISEEYKFHILADGYEDFNGQEFLKYVIEMTENDQAHGVIIVLDTLKKFVNLMDKTQSSNFSRIIRKFALKGGTLIALAHTNKKLGSDGKPIYGGTSDIIDDFDCAYMIAPVKSQADSGIKIVEFENIKRRGNVIQNVGYNYCIKPDISYSQLLASVQQIDDAQLLPLKQAAEIQSDAEIIFVVIACINEGINTKMKLASAVSQRTGISRQSAINIIEKYTGTDPTLHRWCFSVHERGAKVFSVLNTAAKK